MQPTDHDTLSNEPAIDAEQVAVFLRRNPQFFEHNAALLTELYLPSPHGSGTISLAERQQLAQRDKIRVLEAKVAEFLRFGRENDEISDKIHRLSLGLLAAPTLDVMVQLLLMDIRNSFSVAYVSMRLWNTPRNSKEADNEVFQPVADDLKVWAQSLKGPYCGYQPGVSLDHLFSEECAPKSFALLALGSGPICGLLAMASEDEQRFHPEMGTQYLVRISELVSAALLRHTE
jgi:uncharacterized protein YigA (DUF484 family)